MAQPKKGALKEKATILFADESCFRLLPCVASTWALKGETPTLSTPCKYEHLSVASAISWDGDLITMVRESAFNGEAIVEFLKLVLRRLEGKVILIWDGARIHNCQAVKDFLASGATARLRLIRLPPYAPELNPDEGVWRWLKRSMANVCSPTLPALRDELAAAISRLRRRPKIIQSFFKMAGLDLF